MFGGRFSGVRFSLPNTDATAFEVSARFYEGVQCTSDFGGNLDTEIRAFESVGGVSVVTRGIPFSVNVDASVQSRATILGAIPIIAEIKEQLHCRTKLSENINMVTNVLEIYKADIWLSENIHFAALCSDGLGVDVQTGKNIDYDMRVSELLQCMMAVYTLEQEEMRLQVTIPPGGKLYIDSDRFNVLLNGENVIHLHSGDWIHLDRDTVRLIIDSGTGGSLSGNLLVTERYL